MHPCLRAIAFVFCAGLTASALCACQPKAGTALLPSPQTQPAAVQASSMLPGPGSPSPLYRANLCPTIMSLGEDVADAAREHIGVRYRSGGASPSSGFDCSGFVYWVFSKQGVTVLNAPGTVDAGYRGEIKVPLINLDPKHTAVFHPGDRIAQLVIQRYVEARFIPAETLPGSDRAERGFGSTGVAS